MSSPNHPPRRVIIEPLECRTLFSSGIIKLLNGTGTVRVLCHARDATVVTVSLSAGNVLVSLARDLNADRAPDEPPAPQAFAAPIVRRLHVVGGRGNDTISINLAAGDAPQARIRVNGRGGDDVIFGSARGDFLSGGGGNDIIDGRLGGDYLRGGPGNDHLDGGREPTPEVPGQEDPDTADDARDALVGGPGFDILIFADEDVFLPGKGANQVVQP